MAEGGGERIVPVFSRPLVCLQGSDRPVGVLQYVGTKPCGTEQAREAMRLAFEKFERICGGRPPRGQDSAGNGSLFWSVRHPTALVSFNGGEFRAKPVRCNRLPNSYDEVGAVRRDRYEHFDEFSIPLVLKGFGLLDIGHPFFDIVYRLNFDQLHDFRSAESFIDAAGKMAVVLKEAGKRSFNATYLASGSHMTPLIVALLLVDGDVIDEAHFIFTEINEAAVERVRLYLNAIFNGPIGEW